MPQLADINITRGVNSVLKICFSPLTLSAFSTPRFLVKIYVPFAPLSHVS